MLPQLKMLKNYYQNHKRFVAAMLVACGLGIVAVAHTLSLAHGSNQTMDQLNTDPQIDAVVAEGRVATYPDAQITVSAESSGRILRLLVEEKQQVHRGDLIAELDSAELRASLAEAQAKLAETASDFRLAQLKLAQINQVSADAISTLDRYEHQRDLETAAARRDLAAASVDRIQAELDKTRIAAPIDGSVIARFTRAGEIVESGMPIVTIANMTRMRVEAEVNEFDGGKLHVGSPVTITAEGYPGSWGAKIEEVPDVVTNRQLRPQDPGRPSDTGVVLAKIAFLSPTPLKLSQRVEVLIDTGTQRQTH
jgi:HlyD family secretion protein